MSKIFWICKCKQKLDTRKLKIKNFGQLCNPES